MALKFDTGVPWVMCKQRDAPDPVINSCNGRNCGDTFTGPNSPNKPSLWTENWTAQYRVFGDPPSQRAAEDLAFSVARFFSKNGTLVNYYMYHGGTNFGRTTSSFVTTRYYDEAPLDEYGLLREPKWGHLKDLHSALRLCKKALLWGTPSAQALGKDMEARIYEKPGSSVCAAFLANNDTRVASTATFRGVEYYLPPHSISILPDCKTVVYNTRTINAQHSARTYHPSKEANKDVQWQIFQDKIPTVSDTTIKSKSPLEHYSMAKDTTDYFWYTTRLELTNDDLPMRHDIHPVIQVASLGHAMHAFVNDVYIGSGHGNNIDKSFAFRKAISLKTGTNHISLLGMTVGFPDSGAYLEHRLAGVHTVSIQGLNTGTLDLSNNEWGHQIGMVGENLSIFNQQGSQKVQWSNAKGSNQPLTWYKRYFDAPHGTSPVAIDLSSMGKGQVWINGQSIGRYWVSYLTPLGRPSQSEYHIPRAFLKPTDNLLVLFEETGGNPDKISFVTVSRDIICTYVSDFHPPHVKSWARKDSEIHAVVEDMKTTGHLKCPNHKLIQKIEFANFGDPLGVCGNYTTGTCSAPETMKIVQKACLGKSSCSIPVSENTFGSNVCPGITKTLAIQVKCGRKMNSDV